MKMKNTTMKCLAVLVKHQLLDLRSDLSLRVLSLSLVLGTRLDVEPT